MAAMARRGGATGKEKRGTNASPSPSTSTTKKSSKPLISSSRTTPTSSCDHERSTTPMDTKPMPNYLKPTISSIPKRSTTDNENLAQALKPVLNKMRSFDKAPPLSHGPRTTRGSSSTLGSREIKTTRSSSFSHRTTTTSISTSSSSTRTSDRLSARNASKGGKLEHQVARPMGTRRSMLPSNTNKKDGTKGGPSTSSTKKAPKNISPEPCMDLAYEANSIDQHLGIEDHHDMVKIDDDHELQSLPEISEMPESNHELGNPIDIDQVEVKEEYHEQEHPNEEDHDHKGEVLEQESTPLSVEEDEHHDHDHDQEKSMAENQVLEKDQHQTIDEKYPYEEIRVKEVSSFDHKQQAEVNGAEEQNPVEQGAGDQGEPNQKTGPIEEAKEEEIPKQEGGGNKADEKQETETKTQATEVANLRENQQQEEQQQQQLQQQITSSPLAPPTNFSNSISTSVEEKQTTAPPTSVKLLATQISTKKTSAATSAGKKDSPAGNDVIEETSKKLLGKKNKVLALASAFETVISLQDTSPSKSTPK